MKPANDVPANRRTNMAAREIGADEEDESLLLWNRNGGFDTKTIPTKERKHASRLCHFS